MDMYIIRLNDSYTVVCILSTKVIFHSGKDTVYLPLIYYFVR